MIVVGSQLDRDYRNLPSSLWELMPLSGTWKKAIARRGLLRMYQQAMARTQGQPARGKLTSPVGLQPEELLSRAVGNLARMDGADQAARLLGLTTGEVAGHQARARQIDMRLAQSLLGLPPRL